MIGWFPRWNDDGSALTFQRDGQWQNQWFTRTIEIHHDGERLVLAGVRSELPALNELTAGGGKWAGWNPGAVYTSWGQTIPGAGCATLNPDGLFAYVDDRQADWKNLILDGQIVSRGAIASVRMSRQALVWSDSDGTHGLRLDNGEIGRIQAAPAEFFPVPVDTPSGPWVLSQTHTGIILRAFGDRFGYRLDNGGQAFGPDAVYREGRIDAVYTNNAGEQTIAAFDLSAPRVDLSAPIVAPPAPKPAPKPEPAPVPTIPDSEIARAKAEIAAHPLDANQPDLPWIRARAQALGGRWGLNGKRGDVNNLSHDVLAYRVDGGQPILVDALIDGGGANGETFQILTYPEPAGAVWVDPGVPDSVTQPPIPVTPPAQDLAPLFAEIAALKIRLSDVENHAETADGTAIQALNRVLRLEQKPAPRYRVVGGTGRTFGHAHTLNVTLEPAE